MGRDLALGLGEPKNPYPEMIPFFNDFLDQNLYFFLPKILMTFLVIYI